MEYYKKDIKSCRASNILCFYQSYHLGGSRLDSCKCKVVGLLGVLVFHLIFLYLFFYIESWNYYAITAKNNPIIIEFENSPKYYAEANPEIFSNKPDRSERYSFRDQQSSDQSARSDGSNMPLIDGTENNTNKIVPGDNIKDLNSIEKPIAPGIYGNNPNLEQAQGDREQDLKLHNELISINSKLKVNNPFDPVKSYEGSDIFLDNLNQSAKQESLKNIPLTYEDAKITSDSEFVDEDIQFSRPVPMPRPKISSRTTIGPIANTNLSADRFGKIALDATFSEFGDYESELLICLQRHWHNIYEYCDEPIESGYVDISFIIQSDGIINKDFIEIIDSTTSGLLTSNICEASIIELTPHKKWTKEMVEVLGKSKKMTIRFIYY